MTDATTGEGHLVAGRYRLANRIGTGAMGVVWQGHDERLNRPVAVKTLLQEPGHPPDEAAEAVARCLREGRIAARLHHPNATTVFDVVDEDGVPCLVMEYLPSRSLATAIAETGALPPEEVAAIGAQVASALVAAHEAGIVHRDITPGNVLLGEDGSVKLTDFGISHASDDVTVTRTGLIAGTPAYMAPEVALGTDPTTASDVFSLGSTLYAAVEGEPPFGLAPNTLALLHTVAGGRINPPRRAGPLTDVLTTLLVADPQARPTAEQARDLLAAVGEGTVGEGTVRVTPVVAAGEAAAVPAGEPAGEDAVRTQLVDGPGTRVEPVAAHGVHRPLAAAGVLVVAMVAAGIWLLGGRDSVVPADERSPADGPGHSQTTPTRMTAEVEAVREPIDIDEVPAADTRTPPPGATTAGAVPEPTAPVSTAPPSATTTEDAPDPTTTPGTQPGTTPSATTPSTPPTTTTSVTTPPPTSDEESDEEKAEEPPAASGSVTPVA